MVRSCIVSAALLLLAASASPAAETCSMLGGACRDRCGANEQAESGAFDDCEPQQECCVAWHAPDNVGCCVRSFDPKDFGPGNCAASVNAACTEGSASPLSCIQLPMCR
jgi:Beta defensin